MRRGEYQSEICNYGYRKGSNHRLEIDPETAPVVKMIFELVLQTESIQEIIQILYNKGIPTPGEHKASKGMTYHDVSRTLHIWCRSTILRMLADERYTGTYIIGKRTVKEIGGTRSRMKDESEWIKIPDHHPAIVDKALYDKVQAKLRHFRSVKKDFNAYPLKNKVFCGCCGHAMSRLNRKEAAYICRFTKVDKRYGCHQLDIKESELEKLLYDIILTQAQLIANIDGASSSSDLGSQIEKKAAYEKQIQIVNDDKRRLYEQHLRDEIDIEQYKQLKARCDAELAEVKQIYAALAEKVTQMELDRETCTNRQQISERILVEKSLTQALADLLIEKVILHPENGIEVFWKVADIFA